MLVEFVWHTALKLCPHCTLPICAVKCVPCIMIIMLSRPLSHIVLSCSVSPVFLFVYMERGWSGRPHVCTRSSLHPSQWHSSSHRLLLLCLLIVTLQSVSAMLPGLGTSCRCESCLALLHDSLYVESTDRVKSVCTAGW